MTRAECVHGWEWLHVSPVDLDEPSDWLGGRRYLREHCPWCAQWISARPAPTVDVASVVQIDSDQDPRGWSSVRVGNIRYWVQAASEETE